MKDYNKNKKSSYLKYCDVINLYGQTISQTLPVNVFKWAENTSQFDEDFMENYNKVNNEEYFLEVDVQYTEELDQLHSNLPFLLERMKVEKVENLVANFHDKKEYVIHIRHLKQLLNHGLVLEKVHGVIKFNEKPG